MDPDVISFAGVAAISICSLAALAAIGLVFIRSLRSLRSNNAPREVSNRFAIEQRFDQLQQSVDAIAVEVERIAEAQRFSAKLLAERPELRRLSG
jgi:hypothetical protein